MDDPARDRALAGASHLMSWLAVRRDHTDHPPRSAGAEESLLSSMTRPRRWQDAMAGQRPGGGLSAGLTGPSCALYYSRTLLESSGTPFLDQSAPENCHRRCAAHAVFLTSPRVIAQGRSDAPARQPAPAAVHRPALEATLCCARRTDLPPSRAVTKTYLVHPPSRLCARRLHLLGLRPEIMRYTFGVERIQDVSPLESASYRRSKPRTRRSRTRRRVPSTGAGRARVRACRRDYVRARVHPSQQLRRQQRRSGHGADVTPIARAS